MGYFMTTRRPITGLAVDGLSWGSGVGALITFQFFPVGLVVGGGAGFLIGLVAGPVFAVGSRRRCQAAGLALGTIVGTVLVTYGVVHLLFLGDTSPSFADRVATLVVGLAIVPLTVDVVLRARGHCQRGR